jgi:outer membrane protein assembly factor BamB
MKISVKVYYFFCLLNIFLVGCQFQENQVIPEHTLPQPSSASEAPKTTTSVSSSPLVDKSQSIVNKNSELTCVIQLANQGTVAGDINLDKTCETIVSPNEVRFLSEEAKNLTFLAHDLLAQNSCADSEILYKRAYEIETSVPALGYISTRIQNARQCIANEIRFQEIEKEDQIQIVSKENKDFFNQNVLFSNEKIQVLTQDAQRALLNNQCLEASQKYDQAFELEEPANSLARSFLANQKFYADRCLHKSTSESQSEINPSAIPASSQIPVEGASPTPRPESVPSATALPSPTPTPSATITPSPTPVASSAPTAIPVPSVSPGSTKWSFDAGFSADNIVLGTDGTVYVSKQANQPTDPLHGELIALSPLGAEKWRYVLSTGRKFVGESLLVGPSNTIYIIDTNDSSTLLNALYADGSLKWKKSPTQLDNTLSGYKFSQLAVARQNETLIAGLIGPGNSKLIAINSTDQTKKWLFSPTLANPANTCMIMWVALGADSTVYAHFNCGTEGAPIYALDASNGSEKWRYNSASSLIYPAFASDGSLYAYGNGLGKIIALNSSNGTLKWEYNSGLLNIDGISVSLDGTLYAHSMLALNSDGTLKRLPSDQPWGITLPSSGWHSSVVTLANDHSYIVVTGGSSSKPLYAVDILSRSVLFSKSNATAGNFKLLLADDGTLYQLSGRSVFAHQTASTGLEKSSWPKARGNNQNTGQAN